MANVKVRNTTVNGGMTGRDKSINKVFAYRNGKSYSQMKRYGASSSPASIAQQAVRDIFSQTSVNWSNLDQTERNAWNAEAPNWVNTNVFGTKKQSGKNLYTGCNIAISQAGKDLINEPAQKNIDAFPSEAYLEAISALNIELNVPFLSTSVTNVCQLRMSKPQSPGTDVCEKFAIIGNYDTTADIAVNIFAAYESKYGTPAPGEKLFYDIRLVSQGGNNVSYTKGYIVSL